QLCQFSTGATFFQREPRLRKLAELQTLGEGGMGAVSIWVGRARSPEELTEALTHLYEDIDLPDTFPEPEIVQEAELVEIETLIEPLSFSEHFLSEALAIAREKRMTNATCSVAVYAPEDHPLQAEAAT